jgi:hypothetical protein
LDSWTVSWNSWNSAFALFHSLETSETCPQEALPRERMITGWVAPIALSKCLWYYGMWVSNISSDTGFAVPRIDAVVAASCIIHRHLRRKSRSCSPSSYVDQKEVDSGLFISSGWRSRVHICFHCDILTDEQLRQRDKSESRNRIKCTPYYGPVQFIIKL